MKCLALILFTATSLLFITNAYALNKELSLTFWYDSTPPTKNDVSFFNGAAESIKILNSNNIELEHIAKNKGVSIFSNAYAKNTLNTILKQNDFDEDFFYNLEKAQLISVTRMFLNNCRVNNECTEEIAKKYSEQFVIFAREQTNKNRNISSNHTVDINNDTILMALAGAFVVHTVSSIVNADYSDTGSYGTGVNLGDSKFLP